jgi:asparagine synthase (glutamine-hydrolysing)
VLLNGEGADEVIGGYVSFAPRFLIDLLKKRRFLRLGRELYATMVHPERKRIVRELQSLISAKSRRAEASAKAKEFQRKFEVRVEHVEDESARYGDIKDFLDAQVRGYSLPRLLLCNDKMSMANSVEGRAPFLDHEFVDLAFSMETTDLMVNGWRKFPLREAMRGLVPDEILFRRSKDTFNAPIFDYLRSEPIRQRVKEIFREPRTAAIFNPSAYVSEYERFLSRRGADRPFLLHGLFLEEWARMFEVEFA